MDVVFLKQRNTEYEKVKFHWLVSTWLLHHNVFFLHTWRNTVRVYCCCPVNYLPTVRSKDRQTALMPLRSYLPLKKTNKQAKPQNKKALHKLFQGAQMSGWVVLAVYPHRAYSLSPTWVSYSQQWPEAELEASRTSTVFPKHPAESSTGQSCKPSYSHPPQSTALPRNLQPHLGCFSQWYNIVIRYPFYIINKNGKFRSKSQKRSFQSHLLLN